ncbi:MAG: hypothetical protein ACTTJS_05890 [Wolinella sp.]
MQEYSSPVVKLDEKVDALISKLVNARETIENLERQNSALRTEIELKGSEISSLYEELSNKERELEGVIAKLEGALGV